MAGTRDHGVYYNIIIMMRRRRVQLLESGPAVQARVQLLPDPDLHTVLHVGDRVVGVVLAGSERGACTRVAGRHHAADDGHADVRYQRVPAARVLHQGHRRVDGRVPDVRVRRPARVRAGQLRVPVGHAQRRHEQKVRPGARRVHGRRRLRGRPELVQYGEVE